MRDRVTNWTAIFVTTLFLPYCFTMIVSGAYVDQQARERSGICLIDSQGTEMDMEEFLPYMLAGQINLEYEEEALKAQAVIARTNVMKALKGKTKEKIDNLSLVYLSPADFENSFGEKKRERIMGKLKQVVKSTAGKVLTYQDQYIEALYHKVSIGTTVSASEIYGKNIPYLIGVDSSQDVEAEEYMTMSEMEKEEVLERIKTKIRGEGLTVENLMEQLKIGEKTQTGFVRTVQIGQEQIKGEEWQELFSLPSTNFYLEEYEGRLRTISLGQGHCMGLSQYGANEMAKEEKSYEDILDWYYPGTKLSKIEKTE